MASGIRLSFEFVRQYFEDQSCELLETTYKNARTKLKYICSCGTESAIVFDSFQRGNRCKQCGNKKISKYFQLSHEEVVQIFKKLGCELLEQYECSSKPMLYKCVCGNTSKTNLNNLQRGRRCQKCLRVKRSQPRNKKYASIEGQIKKAEYLKFKDRCYKAIKISAKAVGKVKNDRTEAMLGYSITDLKNYVENHVNWPNLKDKRWHLDHIFPIRAFVDYGIDDLKLINCLDNLQPLGYKENIAKSGRYDPVTFELWLDNRKVKYDRHYYHAQRGG